MYLNNIDYFIIVLSLLSGLTFLLLWLEKLHKFYFWLIIWFLFFIVTNSHIRLLAASWDKTSFLYANHSFILSFLVVIIILLWILLLSTDYISFKVKNNIFVSFIFWLIVPFFFLSILSYTYANSFWIIWFLKDFFDYFKNSFIISYLRIRPIIAIYFLYFLILFRLFFWIFLSVIIYIVTELKKAIKTEKQEAKKE